MTERQISSSENSNPSRVIVRQIIFVIALLVCLSSFVSPPLALALGLFIALTFGHPYPQLNHKATKILLQVSVVGLGFGMNLEKVLAAGRSGILFTMATIFGTLFLGFALGKWLKIEARTSHLISSGTAICGGSAIAAVGPVLNATEKEMSVALGTVFILNSVALFIFPEIGHYFNLSQMQFGVWSAIAIHDTSSVVGAAAKYGNDALQIATTVKLARALWIVPLAFFTSWIFKNNSAKISIPYFILLFVVASLLRTYFENAAVIFNGIAELAKIGLTVTLFLIGAGLSWATLKSVGVKPLLLGILLWITVSVVSLWAVLSIL